MACRCCNTILFSVIGPDKGKYSEDEVFFVSVSCRFLLEGSPISNSVNWAVKFLLKIPIRSHKM